MSRLLRLCCLLLVTIHGTSAFSYIPPGKFILRKAIENNGKSIYEILQEVQFNLANETYTVKEKWLVESGQKMAMTAWGGRSERDKLQLHRLYLGQIAHSVSADFKAQQTRTPKEFFEPIFHYRSTYPFAEAIIRWGIADRSILQDQNIPTKKEDLEKHTYTPEPFVRLSRVGGKIAYALGEPASSKSPPLPPGLWLEQDRFVPLKLRLPTQVEMEAANFQQYSRGLDFPKLRTLAWDKHKVTIRVVRVRRYSARSGVQKKLNPSHIERLTKKNQKANTILPQQIPQVTEFYSRFR